MATARVRAANSAPTPLLARTLPRPLATPLGPALLSLHSAAELSPLSQDTLYALFDANMTPLAANTSMQTPEVAKREEMFDRNARFLVVVRERGMPGGMPREVNGRGAGGASGSAAAEEATEEDQSSSPSPQSALSVSLPATNGDKKNHGDSDHSPTPASVDIDAADLIGYASFQFDTEETMGPKDVEVVYCYELQLAPSARGAGLGAVLMKELENIGRERGMRKSMLTCLTGNTTALGFYAKAGYTPDEIDPTRVADEDGWEDLDENGEENHCDYRIMSKVLE